MGEKHGVGEGSTVSSSSLRSGKGRKTERGKNSERREIKKVRERRRGRDRREKEEGEKKERGREGRKREKEEEMERGRREKRKRRCVTKGRLENTELGLSRGKRQQKSEMVLGGWTQEGKKVGRGKVDRRSVKGSRKKDTLDKGGKEDAVMKRSDCETEAWRNEAERGGRVACWACVLMPLHFLVLGGDPLHPGEL